VQHVPTDRQSLPCAAGAARLDESKRGGCDEALIRVARITRSGTGRRRERVLVLGWIGTHASVGFVCSRPAVLVDEVLQRPEDLLERLAADLQALDLRRRAPCAAVSDSHTNANAVPGSSSKAAN
jgi:hypothetical protein